MLEISALRILCVGVFICSAGDVHGLLQVWSYVRVIVEILSALLYTDDACEMVYLIGHVYTFC